MVNLSHRRRQLFISINRPYQRKTSYYLNKYRPKVTVLQHNNKNSGENDICFKIKG